MNLLKRTAFMATILMLPLIVFTALLSNNTAFADALPLSPGCYTQTGTVYTKVNCPDETRARAIVAPYNRCFASKDAGPYNEIGCANGGVIDDFNDETNEFAVTPVNDCSNCITKDIETLVNFAAVGVGVIVVIMIIIGGLQYMASRDNPQAVQAGKAKIVNAVFAFIVFIFTYALLQWLVPGGVF